MNNKAQSSTQQDHEYLRQNIYRLKKLANLLDSRFPLPGGLSIGIDGLIGMIPVIGDIAGLLLSSYIAISAKRLGVSWPVFIHMWFNIGIDAAIGSIPVIGDLFDVAWKTNQCNVELLEQYLLRQAGLSKQDA